MHITIDGSSVKSTQTQEYACEAIRLLHGFADRIREFKHALADLDCTLGLSPDRPRPEQDQLDDGTDAGGEL